MEKRGYLCLECVLGWFVYIPAWEKSSLRMDYEEISRSWIDEWMLNKIFVSTLDDLGLG